MDTEKIGSLIAKLRKEKGLTQKELANQLHITDRAVSKWERGLGCPDISLLDDLAKILEVSISSLLNGEEEVESAIKTTITYATESRKQRIKERVNFLFIIVIVFFLLLAISDFAKVEMRFFKKYPSRSISSFQIFVGNEETYTRDVFEELEMKITTVLQNQGVFKDKDYEIIQNYLKKIQQEMIGAKKLYYQQDYSYKELTEILYYEFVYFRSVEYENLISKVEKILMQYDSNFEASYDLGFTFVYRNEIEEYINSIYRLDISDEKIGEKVIGLLQDKYGYYVQVVDSIMKVGEIK